MTATTRVRFESKCQVRFRTYDPGTTGEFAPDVARLLVASGSAVFEGQDGTRRTESCRARTGAWADGRRTTRIVPRD